MSMFNGASLSERLLYRNLEPFLGLGGNSRGSLECAEQLPCYVYNVGLG